MKQVNTKKSKVKKGNIYWKDKEINSFTLDTVKRNLS